MFTAYINYYICKYTVMVKNYEFLMLKFDWQMKENRIESCQKCLLKTYEWHKKKASRADLIKKRPGDYAARLLKCVWPFYGIAK